MSTREDKVTIEYFYSLDFDELVKLGTQKQLEILGLAIERLTDTKRMRGKHLMHDADLIAAIVMNRIKSMISRK